MKTALTDEIKKSLKQGDKISFRWHGSKELYTGRIEVDEFGRLYFVNEHNYNGDELTNEGMRYYNPLESFSWFTEFKVI